MCVITSDNRARENSEPNPLSCLGKRMAVDSMLTFMGLGHMCLCARDDIHVGFRDICDAYARSKSPLCLTRVRLS